MYYDTKVHGKAAYKKGDYVWLHCPAVPKGCSRKLHRPWQGPFIVVKLIGDVVYRIQLLSNSRQRRVVHYNRLKPYEGCNDNQKDYSLVWERPVTQQQNDGEDQQNMAEATGQNTQESDAPVEQTGESGGGQNNSSQQMQLPQLRRSTRIRRPPEHYGSVVSFPDSDPFPG